MVSVTAQRHCDQLITQCLSALRTLSPSFSLDVPRVSPLVSLVLRLGLASVAGHPAFTINRCSLASEFTAVLSVSARQETILALGVAALPLSFCICRDYLPNEPETNCNFNSGRVQYE